LKKKTKKNIGSFLPQRTKGREPGRDEGDGKDDDGGGDE